MKRTIEDKALIVGLITREQLDHPGYCQETMDAIINSELRQLAIESENYWSSEAEVSR